MDRRSSAKKSEGSSKELLRADEHELEVLSSPVSEDASNSVPIVITTEPSPPPVKDVARPSKKGKFIVRNMYPEYGVIEYRQKNGYFAFLPMFPAYIALPLCLLSLVPGLGMFCIAFIKACYPACGLWPAGSSPSSYVCWGILLFVGTIFLFVGWIWSFILGVALLVISNAREGSCWDPI